MPESDSYNFFGNPENIFGKSKREFGETPHSVEPRVTYDCKPEDVGLHYMVSIDPHGLGNEMRTMGFRAEQISDTRVKVKFRKPWQYKPIEYAIGGRKILGGVDFHNQPIIFAGDIIHEAERSEQLFENRLKGTNDLREIPRRLWRMVGYKVARDMLPEIKEAHDTERPRNINRRWAARYADLAKQSGYETQAREFMHGLVEKTIQKNMSIVLPHELAHTPHAREMLLKAGVSIGILTNIGIAGSGALAASLYKLAEVSHIPLMEQGKEIIALATIAGGYYVSITKSLWLAKKLFSNEPEAYKLGADLADRFSKVVSVVPYKYGDQ